MADINPTMNLEAHYSTSSKVKRTPRVAVSAPGALPSKPLFSDSEANKKFQQINNDIYLSAKKEEKSNFLTFLKYVGIAGILALGIKWIINHFKK